MTETDKVYMLCLEGLDANPTGLRFAELCRYVQQKDSSIKYGTITGAIVKIIQNRPSDVCKPERGLFQLIKYKGKNTTSVSQNKNIHEEEFYQSFADWIVNDLEDCTIAKPLGKNYFKSKWGTPDIIGSLKSATTDVYAKSPEIVSAEIKISTDQLVTAFGQACSYKLFSHKVYLVIPKKSDPKELARIDSLCYLFGIGLVLFDANNINDPEYTVKHRAQLNMPDAYYINQNIKNYPTIWSDLL
jgi:hypothetical protein